MLRRVTFASLLAWLIIRLAFAGPNVAIDNILMSKTNGIATVQIWPGCRMEYIEHTPAVAGVELRIRVRADSQCAELLKDVRSEMYSPSGGRLGNVREVQFDSLSPGETYITLRFNRPSQFQVRQHTVGWIEIFVDTKVDAETLSAAVPPPLPAEPGRPDERSVLPPRSTAFPPPALRRPERQQTVASSASGNFVVQLGIFANPETAVAEINRAYTPHFAYTTSFILNEKTWFGLQLGFFATEHEAETVLTELQGSFPDSWVRYVSDEESLRARRQGSLRDVSGTSVPAVRVTKSAAAIPANLDSLMAESRRALLERRYDDAISGYTQVLQYPNHGHRAEARENIGVAYERNGQSGNAIAEYGAYLNEFGGDTAQRRVRARLTSLQAAQAPVMSRNTAPEDDAAGWLFNGGLSQYYWRNEEQLVHDGNRRVTGSNVLALADFTASRQGERLDVLARVNGSYQFNLLEHDAAGDTGWLSDAWIRASDQVLGLEAQLGRQSRHTDGISGLFDGGALRYQWKPDIHFTASAGFPLDSPRYVSGSERFFYALGAAAEDLWGKVSASAYTHQQTVDGIADRQAVGGEVRYREGPLSVVGLLDYDISYKVLNTALLNGSWHLENDWLVNMSLRVGAQPYLTTRNALAGQSARSIDALLQSYTEGQIRTLARDRTAQASTASMGLTVPLTERLRLSFDVSMRDSDGTVASGGVAAISPTGGEVFYNASVIASSLLKPGDLTMLTVRHDATLHRDSATLILDSRLPFGEGLRINPRLTVTQNTFLQSASEQIIVAPTLRVIYRWKRLMFDLEGGARWSDRDVPAAEWNPFAVNGSEELLGGFVNLGYRLEF